MIISHVTQIPSRETWIKNVSPLALCHEQPVDGHAVHQSNMFTTVSWCCFVEVVIHALSCTRGSLCSFHTKALLTALQAASALASRPSGSSCEPAASIQAHASAKSQIHFSSAKLSLPSTCAFSDGSKTVTANILLGKLIAMIPFQAQIAWPHQTTTRNTHSAHSMCAQCRLKTCSFLASSVASFSDSDRTNAATSHPGDLYHTALCERGV